MYGDYPAITSLEDGGYVVAWQENKNISGTEIFAQIFNADGSKQGGVFQVNTYTYNTQGNVELTGLNDGGFIITWESSHEEGSTTSLDYKGVFGQRFDKDGNAIDLIVKINHPPVLTQNIDDLVMHEGEESFSYSIKEYFNEVDADDSLTYYLTMVDGSPLPQGLGVSSSGVLYATPKNYENGTISVKVTAVDLSGASVSDTFTISVANNDTTIIIDKNTPEFLIDVRTDGTNEEGSIIIANSTSAENGTVFVNIDNTIKYIANNDYSGTDVITYTYIDSQGNTYTATKEITVANVETINNSSTIARSGSSENDMIVVTADTDAVYGKTGIDTALFTGNFADYTLSHSNLQTPLLTHNITNKTVSLHDIEKLEFDNGYVNLRESTDVSNNPYILIHAENGINTNDTPQVVFTEGDDGQIVFAFKETGISAVGEKSNILILYFDAEGNYEHASSLTSNGYLDNKNQENPAIENLGDGRYEVVWNGEIAEQDPNYLSDIISKYAYKDTSTDVIQVANPDRNNSQINADLTLLDVGAKVVVWQSMTETNSWDINGVYVGDEQKTFSINTNATTLSKAQIDPSVTGLDGGSFAVSWTEGTTVMASVFNSNAVSISGDIIIANNSQSAQITTLNNGNFVVTFDENNQIIAKIFTNSGVELQNSTIDISNATGIQGKPEIAGLLDGGFVVAWEAKLDGDHHVYAQRFTNDGNKYGDEIHISGDNIGSNYEPTVEALNDGGYMVAWSGTSDDVYFIMEKRFDADNSLVKKVETSNLKQVGLNNIPDAVDDRDSIVA